MHKTMQNNVSGPTHMLSTFTQKTEINIESMLKTFLTYDHYYKKTQCGSLETSLYCV